MRENQEKRTMNERIQAFYAQSGGPNNPQIPQIIEKHLLYGKDHGVPGRRETFKDAVLDVFLDDFSTKDLVMWLMKTKYDLSDRWQEFVHSRRGSEMAVRDDGSQEKRKLEQLEDRLAAMENQLQTILKVVQQKNY